MQVEDQQLRFTEMRFSIADNDSVTISGTVGFKPRNLIQKIFTAKSRLDKLERL